MPPRSSHGDGGSGSERTIVATRSMIDGCGSSVANISCTGDGVVSAHDGGGGLIVVPGTGTAGDIGAIVVATGTAAGCRTGIAAGRATGAATGNGSARTTGGTGGAEISADAAAFGRASGTVVHVARRARAQLAAASAALIRSVVLSRSDNPSSGVTDQTIIGSASAR